MAAVCQSMSLSSKSDRPTIGRALLVSRVTSRSLAVRTVLAQSLVSSTIYSESKLRKLSVNLASWWGDRSFRAKNSAERSVKISAAALMVSDGSVDGIRRTLPPSYSASGQRNRRLIRNGRSQSSNLTKAAQGTGAPQVVTTPTRQPLAVTTLSPTRIGASGLYSMPKA